MDKTAKKLAYIVTNPVLNTRQVVAADSEKEADIKSSVTGAGRLVVLLGDVETVSKVFVIDVL